MALGYGVKLLAQQRVVGAGVVARHGVAGKRQKATTGLLAGGELMLGCLAGLPVQGLQVLHLNSLPTL